MGGCFAAMGFACPLPLGMYWLTVTFALCACGNFAFSPDCLGVLSPAWESETGRERGNWDWIPRCCFAGVAICGYFWCVVKGGILGCLGRLLRRGAGGGDSLGWKLGLGNTTNQENTVTRETPGKHPARVPTTTEPAQNPGSPHEHPETTPETPPNTTKPPLRRPRRPRRLPTPPRRP